MGRRLQVHNLLLDILEADRVYYQAPSNVTLDYPCIIYERDDIVPDAANNKPYSLRSRYSVTVIDRDPDSEIPDKLAALPLCRLSRYFRVDNLHHNVFTLY